MKLVHKSPYPPREQMCSICLKRKPDHVVTLRNGWGGCETQYWCSPCERKQWINQENSAPNGPWDEQGGV